LENDKCRKCKVQAETTEHVTSGCTAAANTDCLRRHDNVAKIIHQQLAEKCKLLSDHVPYCKYDPANVTENNEVKKYWDREICTDVKINANRPDLILYNEQQSEVTITEVVIPLTSNIQKTYTTKISKYSELAQEIKKNVDSKEDTVMISYPISNRISIHPYTTLKHTGNRTSNQGYRKSGHTGHMPYN
jgi:hypothetical protein